MEDHLENLFWQLGCHIMKHCTNSKTSVGHRRFRSVFGVSSRLCAAAWTEISPFLEKGGEPIHLLYALVFLKHGLTEHVNRIFFDGIDEKTFRKYNHRLVDALATFLNHVVFNFYSYLFIFSILTSQL